MSRTSLILALAALCAAPVAPAAARPAPEAPLTLCRNQLCMEDRGEPLPGRLLTYGVDFELGDRGFTAVDCIARIIAAPGTEARFVAGSLPDLLCRLRGYDAPAVADPAAGAAESQR